MAATPDVELRDDEIVQRARQADALLKSEILQEAFERAEEAFTRAMVRAETPERREAEAAKIQALAEVKRALRTLVGRGEFILSRQK